MKSIFTFVFALFIFCTAAVSQTKIDSTAKPDETTFYDGPSDIIYAPGLVIKTRSGHYYEITDKAKFKNTVPNPAVTIYKQGKKKYQLVIQGIEIPIEANKVPDVTESNIDGDFKGWEGIGVTVFKLINGDSWVQDQPGSLFSKPLYRPKVFIYRAADGTYKMKIDGVEQVVIVKRADREQIKTFNRN